MHYSEHDGMGSYEIRPGTWDCLRFNGGAEIISKTVLGIIKAPILGFRV